ncbi:21307_t:CDS:2, partial [Cetraspora pellucida]
AICKACYNILGEEAKLNATFVNQLQKAQRHCFNCEHFKNSITKDEFNKLLSKSKKNQEISDSIIQTMIDLHLAHQYTPPKKKNWKKLVLDATVANGGRILKVKIQQLNSIQKEKVIKDIVGVTFAFDGWKNINKESFFGKILITSNGKVLIWGVEDISAELDRTIIVIPKIETFLEHLKENQIKVVAVVSNSALAYAAACWFSLVDDEELAYDEFNEFECNVTFDEENINAKFIACETQHSADNCNAKWLLEKLFINNLPEPSYVLAAKKHEEKKKKKTEYLHQIAEKNNQNSVIEIEENKINHSNENN